MISFDAEEKCFLDLLKDLNVQENCGVINYLNTTMLVRCQNI